MSAQRFGYSVEFYSREGRRLGRRSIEADFSPALEWVWLQGLRRGRLSSDCLVSDGVITPVWNGQIGAPYLEALRVEFASGGVREELDLAFLQPFALQASGSLVHEGQLAAEESCHYLVLAFEAEAQAVAPPHTLHLTITHRPPLLPLHPRTLSSIQGRSRHVGRRLAEDLPVFLPESVLQEVKTLAQRAGGQECGGVLLGHLYRDADLPEVFAEVKAQIPAEHVEADAHRLTFTARTWRAVEATIEQRGARELMLGWWHSHPVGSWCSDCTPEKRRACPLKEGFLSSQDRKLHQTVFPRAYSLALVVTASGEAAPVCDLFGWRRGLLERRGYGLLMSQPSGHSPLPSSKKEMRHA